MRKGRTQAASLLPAVEGGRRSRWETTDGVRVRVRVRVTSFTGYQVITLVCGTAFQISSVCSNVCCQTLKGI